jgi:hypothetical protein
MTLAVGNDPARTAAVARHEAAHVAAAYLLGREIARVRIHSDGGEATVARVRDDVDDADLEQVIDDILVLAIGGEVDRRSWPRAGGDEGDQALAWDLAERHTASRREAEALVELGRAKAATLAEQRGFQLMVERLTDRLVEAGELDGDDLRDIIENGGSNDGPT